MAGTQQGAKVRKLPDRAITASFADLEAEAKAEPFVYKTKAGVAIEFPDPFDMEFSEAEKFLSELVNMTDSEAALAKWLSEEDLATLLADKLTLRQMLGLINRVHAHYEAVLGTPGEGKPSGS
jgi:hypothetical protein